jgi:hypothetical protein
VAISGAEAFGGATLLTISLVFVSNLVSKGFLAL